MVALNFELSNNEMPEAAYKSYDSLELDLKYPQSVEIFESGNSEESEELNIHASPRRHREYTSN